MKKNPKEITIVEANSRHNKSTKNGKICTLMVALAYMKENNNCEISEAIAMAYCERHCLTLRKEE